MRHMIRRPSPAMIIACLALLVALGGTSVAAIGQVPRASVGTPQLKRNAVTAAKINPNAIRTGHVLNGTLLSEDFKPGQIPQGPKGDKGDPGSPGVSEFQRVNAQSAFNSNTPKTAIATCPAGKRVIGGGAGIVGAGTSDVVLRASGPNINGVDWAALGVEVNPTAADWYVTAVALCARVP